MDDNKKALLTIDIDTSALIKNLNDAKSAVSDLTDQLNAMKTSGQANTPVFTALSKQLSTTTTDYNNATKAIKAYTDALSKKTQTEQTAAKTPEAPPASQATDTSTANNQQNNSGSTSATQDGPDPNAPTLQAVQTTDIQSDGLSTNVSIPQKDFLGTNESFFKKELTNINNFIQQKLVLKQKEVDADTKLLQARDDAYLKSATIVSGLLGQQTIAGKVALDAKKIFTIAEIAINTEQAVSAYVTATASAVQQDMKIPVVGPALAAADIAWGAVEVAGVIASGVKQTETLNAIQIPTPSTTGTSGSTSGSTPTGKARGGVFISDGLGAYLTGPGSGTSDSINARLSNGESVINARSTQMFAPILSAINQAGGGVAFDTGIRSAYASGGLFNGSNTYNDASNDLATTRATNNMIKTITANMPRQVLVVEDVQASLQNKVMLQNMSNF